MASPEKETKPLFQGKLPTKPKIGDASLYGYTILEQLDLNELKLNFLLRYPNGIAIMLPNILGFEPVITWDCGKLQDPKDQKEYKECIESYGGISPFTKTFTHQNTAIHQINYPLHEDFATTADQVVNYITSQHCGVQKATQEIQECLKTLPPITVYWQSLGWKLALEVAAKLLQKGFKIKTVILNSAPLDLEDILPQWQNLAKFIKQNKILAYLRWKLFQIIPPRLLVGKSSASPQDSDLEIDRNELRKIARSLQWKIWPYKMSYQQLRERIQYLNQPLDEQSIQILKDHRVPIIYIQSSKDPMISPDVPKKLEEIFPWQVIVKTVDAKHAEVAEKPSKYTNALQEALEEIQKLLIQAFNQSYF